MAVESDIESQVEEAVEDLAKQAGKKLITEWKAASEQKLDRARIDRDSDGLSNIIEAFTDPEYAESENAWTFNVEHTGAIYQEYGADEHEIRARQASFLAFEWPDAPPEVKEQFEDTEGDLVFFQSINHPGIPPIYFMRHGRIDAIRSLDDWEGEYTDDDRGESP